MPRRLPWTRRALAALAAGAALIPVLPALPATAQATAAEAVIDLTFPAGATGWFSDDYTAGRSGGRTHCALDILGTKHSPVYAAVGGTITSMPTTKPSYGYVINVAGDDGRRYSYLHLNDDNPGTDDDAAGPALAYAPGLAKGSKVTRGQAIGYLGDSGNAKGTPHLHFEIHDPSADNPVCASGGAGRINPYPSVLAAKARGDVRSGGPAPVAPKPATPSSVKPRGIDRACRPGAVPRAAFADVFSNHRPSVDCLAFWSIAAGRDADTFGPRDDITRAQLATFVTRLAAAAGRPLPAAPRDLFDDDGGSVHEDSINRVGAAGIMGSADRRFSPKLAVTRGSMATVVAGTYRKVSGRTLPAAANAFADDDGTSHAANIDRIAATGIAAGFGDGRFGPTTPVSREQMTTFLARLLDALVEGGYSSARA